MQVVPLVLAGGMGTRLWPLSRSGMPKQFHRLLSGDSMLANTLKRAGSIQVADSSPSTQSYIFTSDKYRFLVGETVVGTGINASIYLEPEQRGTAPPVVIAALDIVEKGDDAILVVMPSDHYIEDEGRFQASVAEAVRQAEAGYIVCLGTTPTDTTDNGYGFIVPEASIATPEAAMKAHKIAKFVEKPSPPLLKSLQQQGCLWNCGIFVLRAKLLLEELARLEPNWDMHLRVALQNRRQEKDFIWLEDESFTHCAGGAFDCIIMEQTDKAAVVELTGWNDLGSWHRLYHVSPKDENNNFVTGEAVLSDVKDTIVYNEDGPLVVAANLSEKVIVGTRDAVFVSDINSQVMSDVLTALSTNERRELTDPPTVYRPWGFFESIHTGEGFQVKRLGINPGAEISVQRHFKRSEHWVVLKGTADVLLGDTWRNLEQGQSIFIPVETIHSVRNNTEEMLYIVEVQLGTYLGEDDIERLSDIYGRNSEDA